MAAHKARIILVAPPPVNEHLLWSADQANGLNGVSRRVASTRDYAEAACKVGAKLHVPVVNLWTTFMSKAGWDCSADYANDSLPGSLQSKPNDVLIELMYDGWSSVLSNNGFSLIHPGLHFHPAGYQLLFDEVMDLVRIKWPDQLPENLPMVIPDWKDGAAWDSSEAC